MNMIAPIAIGAVAIVAGAIWFPTMARVALSRADINACAAQWALKNDYKGDVMAYLVDNGSNADLIATSDGYHRSIGLDTVYTTYAREGTKLCLQLKITGKPIPKSPTEANLPKGYHITRWNGSAALVKDGDEEPKFGCMEGYRPTGSACVKE